jgi:hypothetical protein
MIFFESNAEFGNIEKMFCVKDTELEGLSFGQGNPPNFDVYR